MNSFLCCSERERGGERERKKGLLESLILCQGLDSPPAIRLYHSADRQRERQLQKCVCICVYKRKRGKRGEEEQTVYDGQFFFWRQARLTGAFFFLLWLYGKATFWGKGGEEVWGYGFALRGKNYPKQHSSTNPPSPAMWYGADVFRRLSLQSNLQLAKATFRLASVLSLPSKTALSARRTNRSCALTQIDFCLSFFPFSLSILLSLCFLLQVWVCTGQRGKKGQSNRSSQRATH